MEDEDDSKQSDNLPFVPMWQGFKLFCGEQSQKLHLKGANHALIPLSQGEVGDVVCIVEIQIVNCIDYLFNMGLIPGTELQIISTSATGDVVVNFDDKCLGLGADMANGIFVRRFS
ncbi:MAG: FeoA family protein [Cyanobacteria bacterium J06635_10]